MSTSAADIISEPQELISVTTVENAFPVAKEITAQMKIRHVAKSGTLT